MSSNGSQDAPSVPAEPDLGELTTAVEQLYELFGELRGQVESLADAMRPSPSAKVIRWADLDAEAAEEAWSGLRRWVSWLLDRYAVKEVPRGCWWRHGLLVEELTALWLAWQAAFGEKADATSPLIWHEHFDRARDRIRQRLQQQGNCSSGEHHEPVPQQPVRGQDAEDEEFAAFVDADIAGRPAASPEPSAEPGVEPSAEPG
jgi:hypothetical protein